MKSYNQHVSWQNFVHNVKWLRIHYDFSKEKMSKVLGITVEMLEKIENNEIPADLTAEAILNLGNFFLVEPEKIMGRHLDSKK